MTNFFPSCGEGKKIMEHGASTPEGQIVIKSSGKFLKKGAIISLTPPPSLLIKEREGLGGGGGKSPDPKL